MKKQIVFLIFLAICCSCARKEKLLIGGSGWQHIAIVDKKSGKIQWIHDLAAGEECNKVEMTPKGHILYAYGQGARLIDRKHKIIWDYKVNEGEELHHASYLESGDYLLAVCGNPARIVELDKDGNPGKELTFDTLIPEVHNQFRQILKTPQNTYLIPLMGKNKITEIDENGSFVKSVMCGGTPFSIKLIDEGNWLVSCGDGRCFIEIHAASRHTIKKVETSDLNWSSLLFVAEAIRYDNGNTLIANWNGRSNDKMQPLLMEINPENRIVWRLPFNPAISHITTVYSFY